MMTLIFFFFLYLRVGDLSPLEPSIPPDNGEF